MEQGPLVLGRRAGEKIRLTIDPAADPREALRRIADEGIRISIASTPSATYAHIGIRAPQEVLVLRDELEGLDGTRRREVAPMGCLSLTRRVGDQIRLAIALDADTEQLLQLLLRYGITFHVREIALGRVRAALQAPREVLVLREELVS